MARRKNVKKQDWPCGYCVKNCDSDCVYCETCEQWFHALCQNLTHKDLAEIGNVKEAFLCIACRTDSDGQFDYLMDLSRLNKATEEGIEKLRAVAERESKICDQVFTFTHNDPKDLTPDHLAEEMRKKNTTNFNQVAVYIYDPL